MVSALSDCFVLNPQQGKHIDPVKLLQYLKERAKVLAERAATSGLEAIPTESYRGQRITCLVLQKEIEEEMKHGSD